VEKGKEPRRYMEGFDQFEGSFYSLLSINNDHILDRVEQDRSIVVASK
jgi:hypothetical protein